MSSDGRVWAVATAHFDYVTPGDRLRVDPSDPYVVGNRLFESGFLVLEGEPDDVAADAPEPAANDAEGEAPGPSGPAEAELEQ